MIVNAVPVHHVMSPWMITKGYSSSVVALGVFQVMASSSSSTGTVQVYISSRSLDGGFLLELIGVGQQGLCQSGSEELQWMASVFIVANILKVELCMEFAV